MSFDKTWQKFVDHKIAEERNRVRLFQTTPVSPQVFFKEWLRPELSKDQLDVIDSMFDLRDGELRWSSRFYEYLLLWGEGSGKDFLCSRILTYCAYYLICLGSPQKYLGIAEEEPIDLINVSLTGTHAKNVFFYKFKTALRAVRNPKTGRNWFEEQGMDLRDGKDVQTTYVTFPKSIRAHSLNSQTYGGEGMNVLIAVFDEVAEFRVEDAQVLYKALRATETSRFGQQFKLMLISYMRHENDFMMYRWKLTEKEGEGVYRSMRCTWEVNPLKKRSDFDREYAVNPEESARRYENKNLTANKAAFIQYPKRIVGHCDPSRVSPIIGSPLFVEDIELESLAFHDWFKKGFTQRLYELKSVKVHEHTEDARRELLTLEAQHNQCSYHVHVDLAKANVDKNNDCAGFSMVHKYLVNPFQEEDYDAEGVKDKDRVYEDNFGVYVDLMMQLRSKKELDFELVRKFIYRLKKMGFNIVEVTLDGWQSVDFRQRLTDQGILTKELSVDKKREPYETLKGLLYTQKLNYYKYDVFLRELRELEDRDGKIDHPAISNARVVLEGTDKGSKDVSDAVCGAVYNSLTASSNEDSDWFSVT